MPRNKKTAGTHQTPCNKNAAGTHRTARIVRHTANGTHRTAHIKCPSAHRHMCPVSFWCAHAPSILWRCTRAQASVFYIDEACDCILNLCGSHIWRLTRAQISMLCICLVCSHLMQSLTHLWMMPMIWNSSTGKKELTSSAAMRFTQSRTPL